jgi:hypothetical protein
LPRAAINRAAATATQVANQIPPAPALTAWPQVAVDHVATVVVEVVVATAAVTVVVVVVVAAMVVVATAAVAADDRSVADPCTMKKAAFAAFFVGVIETPLTLSMGLLRN